MKKKVLAVALSMVAVGILGYTLHSSYVKMQNQSVAKDETILELQSEIEHLKAEQKQQKEEAKESTTETDPAPQNTESVEQEKSSAPQTKQSTDDTNSTTPNPTPVADHTTSTQTPDLNPGTVFEGYEVTVYNSTTPAELLLTQDPHYNENTVWNFLSAQGEVLGSISGMAYMGISTKYQVLHPDGWWAAPDGSGEWEEWFADKFNEYRGVSQNTPTYPQENEWQADDNQTSTIPNQPDTTPSEPSHTAPNVDTQSYALTVIDLINREREDVGLPPLEIISALMAHSEIRAQELETDYSHTRPNGEVQTSECVVKRRDTPAQAVQSWMQSDNHRPALVNDTGEFPYNYIGAGCHEDADGILYWVVTFAV